MTTSNKPAKPTAEDAYIAGHIMASDLMDQLNKFLQDLPSPETEGVPIHWGHVGTVGHINDQLHELMKSLTKEKG